MQVEGLCGFARQPCLVRLHELDRKPTELAPMHRPRPSMTPVNKQLDLYRLSTPAAVSRVEGSILQRLQDRSS